MPMATITSKGRITLPREVREHLHVGKGDRVEFEIERDGEVGCGQSPARWTNYLACSAGQVHLGGL